MGKMNPQDLSTSGPKVTPDDLEEEAAVLTISDVEEVEVDDVESPTGKRKSWTLKFEELGEKLLWLNKTQAEYLVERLGTDTDAMIGQFCPVEKHTSKFGRKDFAKVWVSPPESWDDLLRAAGKPIPRQAKGTPKKAATTGKTRRR